MTTPMPWLSSFRPVTDFARRPSAVPGCDNGAAALGPITGASEVAKRSLTHKALRQGFTVAVLAFVALAAYDRRSQITQSFNLFHHLSGEWLALAVSVEGCSMVVFAALQRWLLQAGGVRVPAGAMIEITLAGNALSTSLPGGVAWSATWAFGQLRRRGADRFLSAWVLLVAGALSFFALFVILVVGIWVAGGYGPAANLRPLAAGLAAVPVIVAAGYYLAGHLPVFDKALAVLWAVTGARVPGAASAGHVVGNLTQRLRAVHPGPAGWAAAFTLALSNWLCDLVCLIGCALALGVGVPWRGVLVVYGLTQVAASLPVTPGGLGVVEGSMTALLVAYGLRGSSALAVVVLYRLVSFWAVAPVGWVTWFAIDLAERSGQRLRPHPWAYHLHADALPRRRGGPERVLPPRACNNCADGPGTRSHDSGDDASALSGATFKQ